MLPTRQSCSLLLLLVSACRSAPAVVDSPAPPGSYEGSCDAGQGRLDLRSDQSFSFHLHFDYFDVGWDLQGHWHMLQRDEPAWSPDIPFVELAVERSRLDIPARVAKERELEGAKPEFPVGTRLLVTADAHEVMFSGPCVTFFLPRVR